MRICTRIGELGVVSGLAEDTCEKQMLRVPDCLSSIRERQLDDEYLLSMTLTQRRRYTQSFPRTGAVVSGARLKRAQLAGHIVLPSTCHMDTTPLSAYSPGELCSNDNELLAWPSYERATALAAARQSVVSVSACGGKPPRMWAAAVPVHTLVVPLPALACATCLQVRAILRLRSWIRIV
jgi:hypothetical protein